MFGRYRLIAMKCQDAKRIWGICAKANIKNGDSVDIIELINQNVDSVAPVCPDPKVNLQHCRLVMDAIVTNSDIESLIQRNDFTFDHWVWTAALMEEMEIHPHIWSVEVADRIFAAKMHCSLGDLYQLNKSFGVVASERFRAAIHTAVTNATCHVSDALDDIMVNLPHGNPHIIPSTDQLVKWLKHGWILDWDDQGKICFRDNNGPGLIRCVQLISKKCSVDCVGKMWLGSAAHKVVNMVKARKNGRMSDVMIEFWRKMWDKLGITLMQSYGGSQLVNLLIIQHWIGIGDSKLDSFVQSLEFMLQKNLSFDFWAWRDLMHHCVDTAAGRDISSVSAVDNEAILQASRVMFQATCQMDAWCIDFFDFIPNYIKWLYRYKSDNEQIIVDTLKHVIVTTTRVLTRLQIITQIFLYYTCVHKNHIPQDLIKIFKENLPVEYWNFNN